MKKLLPPILFVLFVIAMALLCWSLGSPHQLSHPFTLVGLLFVAAGLMLAISGKKLFKKLGTNVMTFDEPDVLVTEGVFRYSRNPMYLGFVIALLGFAFLMGAALSSFILTLLFLVITDKWYIAYEENVMRSKFGDEYEAYCRSVRRWI